MVHHMADVFKLAFLFFTKKAKFYKIKKMLNVTDKQYEHESRNVRKHKASTRNSILHRGNQYS